MAETRNSPRAFVDALGRDGMTVAEVKFASRCAATAVDHDAADIATADFVAAAFFPQSAPGQGGGQATAGAVQALGSSAGGDDLAPDAYARSALDGKQKVTEQAYTELAGLAGALWTDPLTVLGDFGQAVKEGAAGKPGPLARAMAEVASRGAAAPAETAKRLSGDIDAAILHGQPCDVLFGPEGTQRAAQILGPVGSGYDEQGRAGGEVRESPGGFANDVKETAVSVATEAWRSFTGGARGIYNWGRSFSK